MKNYKKWYSPREAVDAGFFPFGYQTLLDKINAGEIKAVNISGGTKPIYRLSVDELKSYSA